MLYKKTREINIIIVLLGVTLKVISKMLFSGKVLSELQMMYNVRAAFKN